MPKPAHSHPQSSLQSVWDVGRYLSRYPVAGVAFKAPGTCKQCTPQITVICGGATVGAGTACKQVSHLQTAQSSEGCLPAYVAHCARSCCPASVPCNRGTSVQQIESQCAVNSTRAAYLTVLQHAVESSRGHRARAKYLKSAGGASPAQTEMIPSRLEAHETAHGMGQFIPRAKTYKQRWRGALLVRSTYG